MGQSILKKRILRDLRSDLVRYIALAFMIILCMYIILSVVDKYKDKDIKIVDRFGTDEDLDTGKDEKKEKAKEEKRILALDPYEHGVVINALNDMRNDLIGEDRPTDIVDEILLKTIDAPTKKVRSRDEAR